MSDGFYKLDGDMLLHGPNYVYAPTFTLLRELKDGYQYPIDGWRWFDTEAEARAFHGLPAVEPD